MKSRFSRRAGALLLSLVLAFSLVPAAGAAVTGVTLDETSLTLKLGETETATLTATVTADAGEDETVTWEVSGDADAVTITENGNRVEVTAVKEGNATITAKSTVDSSQTAACAVRVEAADPPPAPTVTKVEVSPKTLDMTVGGNTEQLSATVTMSDGSTPPSVTWSVTAGSAVTVSGSGVVTAVSAGNATVTASAGGQSDSCTVTVTTPVINVPVTGVTVDGGQNQTVTEGKTLELRAVIEPAHASNKNVTWSSADSTIASVDRNTGVVTGVKAGGPVSITVTTEDGSRSASVNVTVVSSVADFGVTPSRGVNPINVGVSTMTLSAGTDKAVTWSSEDETIATVNSSGQVTGVSPGKVKITATAEDGSKGEYMVEVSGLVIEETSINVVVGYSKTIAYQAFGAAATSNDTPRWSANPESIATVTSGGRVTGMAPGITTITVTKGRYTAECKVTVEEDVANAIERTLNAGEKLDFPGLLSDLNSRCREKTEAALDYITNLQVATTQGILHYRYGSPNTPNHGVGGIDRYYTSAASDSGRRAISDLSFVPAGGFKGTAIIEYTGYSTEGQSFHGTVRVEVKNSGDVTYSTAMGRSLTLTAKEFKDICQLKTSRNASYVTFTQPSSSKGVLYYNYTPGQYSQKVDGTTKYYLTSTPSLEKVTFVPADNFTGSVSIPYRCTDTTGGGYSGTMTINIYAADGGGSGGVEYTTGVNQRVTLNASDFNEACREFNDRTLSYIYFDELPDVSQGILYYSYTSASSNRVDTSTRYNRSNTGSRISSVTFVPASNFSGTVTVPYTGYDTAGQTYKDNLVIHVTDAAGTVYYSTDVDDPVTFRAEDFNEACQRANNSSLNYISFTLPSSSVGTLYRNYRSSSNTGTRVSSSTRFYRGGTPSVSDITFVPKSRYEGTVSIPFSGVDASGAEFEGTVSISVGQGTGRVVSYSTASGGVVRFSASDFNTVCRSATGDDLSYLSFELPASRYGTLYYQYNAGRGTGTQITTSTYYYRTGGSRLLDDVYFASANVNGVASFQYTARSTGGERFTGTVEIAIGNAGLDSGYSNGTRYIGSSAPITLRTQDFESACQSAVGGTLSYIRFDSLPSERAGRLYMNYESPSRPGAPATTTSNYTASSGLTIGQLSFVPKAEYQGQVNIPYTGYSAQGGTFSGNVTIDISNSYCATPFYDVDSGWDWAKPSVEFLRYAGISNGYSNGSFRPSRSISRGEFTLMVCRAFGFDTSAKVSSFPDVPASSPYAGAVATAQSMGIVEGSGGRFRPDSAITRQSAMTIICRAMKAAGDKVPATGSTILNTYSDQARIASHARESVAALVSLGVVRGSSDMRINPTRSISRAEMAVILHRVLTL
ncbi:Ig-like domain-containing protein [Oscillospiraceae bacterium 50-60]